MTQENHWIDTLWPTIFASGETLVDLPGTTGIILPIGTTLERPLSPINGMMRFNTDFADFEIYNGGWAILAGVAGVNLSRMEDGDVDTEIYVENFAGLDDDTIAFKIGDNSGTYMMPAANAVLVWNTSGFDIETPTGNAGNSGVDFTITTGNGNIAADGGSLNLTSGDGGATGGGGTINITGGAGGATSGAGGGAYVIGGDAPFGTGGSLLMQAGSSGTGSPSGNIFITGGETNGANGGPILITGGNVMSGVGIGGQVQIATGTSLAAAGAPISLTAGAGDGAANAGGAITLTGGEGDASNGSGGAVSLVGGLGGTGTGGGGSVSILGGLPQLSGAGGDVNVTAADALGIADGGDITLTAGAGAGGGSAGAVVFPDQLAPTSTTNKLYSVGGAIIWNGITLGGGGGSGIGNVSDDTTPQLGGPLDVNGFDIISASNANININPNGTGNVLLGTLPFDADQTIGIGQDNYVLTYDNASGLISLEPSAGGGGGGDVTKVGTPVNNQIGVWTGDGTLEGDSDFTWDGTTLTVNGDIALNGNIAAELGFEIQTGLTYGPGAFTLAHSGKMVTMDNASPNTVTLPSNASLAYPIGTEIHFQQLGAGTTTIAIDTDTLNVNGNLLLALNGQYAVATALKMTATTWTLFGNLVPI